MTLIEKAIDLALRAHAGQKRKYNGLPYIVHPTAVAAMAHELGLGEIAIAAAWLHDVLEDCDENFCMELRENFPAVVINLVDELTNPSKGSNEPRELRKKMDRDHLVKVSKMARMIKLIDRTVNLADLQSAQQTTIADIGVRKQNRLTRNFVSLYCKESRLLLDALKGTDENLEKVLLSVIDKTEP